MSSITLTPPASSGPSGPAGGVLSGSYPDPGLAASPALTGTPTAPTPSSSDNSTTIATTAFVKTQSGLLLPLTGGTMSGAIAMGSNKITGLANGTASTDAAAFGQLPTSPLPGQILATQVYTTTHTYTVAVTTMAALDTTNATLSFTVPASGIVDIVVSFVYEITSVSTSMMVGLFNHTGGAIVGLIQGMAFTPGAGGIENSYQSALLKFHLTSLTPGALQLDLAAGVTTAKTAAIQVTNNSSKTVASNSVGAPLLMQAIASI
jgi:hypothetical protein